MTQEITETDIRSTISDPAVREALENLCQTFARLDAGIDQLERIARRSSREDEIFNPMTGSWETLGERFGR